MTPECELAGEYVPLVKGTRRIFLAANLRWFSARWLSALLIKQASISSTSRLGHWRIPIGWKPGCISHYFFGFFGLAASDAGCLLSA